MTSPLTDFVTITFQATADTPAGAQVLDGKTVLFPPEYLAAAGSGPTNPGVITAGGQKIRGYLDTTIATNMRWVMTGELSAALVAQIDAIPGVGGWARPASRTLYIGEGRELVRLYGVPAADAVTVLNALYSAAVANRGAQIAAGG